MGERIVLCGGVENSSRRAASELRLSLGGPNANIWLRIEDISRRMVADVPGNRFTKSVYWLFWFRYFCGQLRMSETHRSHNTSQRE